MKISRKDLDPSILEKLDLLDNVVTTFDPNSPEGVVSYGSDGFYFKKTNNTLLKKVYDEDEIVELEQSLHSTKRNIKTTEMVDMRIDTSKYNASLKKFLYSLPFSNRTPFTGNIAIMKQISIGLLVLTDDGVLTRVDGNPINVNIIELLKDHFNLSNQLQIYDIVDLAEIDDNNYLVATKMNGVYKVNLATREVELVFNVANVKTVDMTHTGNVFITTNEFVAQYDLKSGKCAERYSNVYNSLQLPYKTLKTDIGMFVLGAPCGNQSIENLLHFWKLDKEGVGYNLADNMLGKNPIDNKYQVLFATKTGAAIYLVGKIHDKIFVWKYDFETLAFHEEIIDCLNLTTLNGYICINDEQHVFLSGNRLYVVKDNEMTEHYKLDSNCNGLYLQNNILVSLSGKDIVEFTLPKFEAKAETLSFMIFDSEETCNNIDIFVQDAGRRERITLIDVDTNREIEPTYYFIYNGNSVIKLMNCKSTKIKMTITVSPTASIGGIVVKNNRLFLR